MFWDQVPTDPTQQKVQIAFLTWVWFFISNNMILALVWHNEFSTHFTYRYLYFNSICKINLQCCSLMQAIWGNIWKFTVEKRQTNATNVTMHPPVQTLWGHIWKHTAAKSQINATSVAMHPFGQANWWHTWKGMFKIDGVIDLNCTNLAICWGYVGNIE